MPQSYFRRPVQVLAIAVAMAVPAAAFAEKAPERSSARVLVDTARAKAAATAQKVWHGAQDVAMFALGLIGVEYRWGGNTPDDGLDCSGLIHYVFQQVTGVTLPRTAREMAQIGTKVSADDLKPGDLVFFNTRKFAFSHVGLYLGDNRFIHAPSRGSEVEIAQLSDNYWQKHFNGARRLVGVLPSLVPNVITPAEASTGTPASATATPSAEGEPR